MIRRIARRSVQKMEETLLTRFLLGLLVLLLVFHVPGYVRWIYIVCVLALTLIFRSDAERQRARRLREEYEDEYRGPLR